MRFFVIFIILLFSKLSFGKNQIIEEIRKIELSVEIAKMVGADQAFRFAGAVIEKKGISWENFSSHEEFQKNLGQIDSSNAKRVKQIFKEYGWLKISDYGKYTAHNMWLLVQHMDSDVNFQEKILSEMKNLLVHNEIIKSEYAYLYDRVRVNKGKSQFYGTQGKCVGKGLWEPRAVEDVERLDKRRAEMDLPPMAEYRLMFKEMCTKADI